MKHIKVISHEIIAAAMLCSCLAEPSPYGVLKGKVIDANSGIILTDYFAGLYSDDETETIYNCTEDGFVYNAITPGSYHLTINKDSYNTITITDSINAGDVVEKTIKLTKIPALSIDNSIMDFSYYYSSLTFFIDNISNSDYSISISNLPSWLTADYYSATVKAQSTYWGLLYLDRSLLSSGCYYSHILNINYSGEDSGVLYLTVKAASY